MSRDRVLVMGPRERLTRGDLPHWYVPGAAHFVTYRLAGTIPKSLLHEWRQRREGLVRQPPPIGVSATDHRMRLHKKFFTEYDRNLDNHRDICWLSDSRVAAVVRENLYHHNGTKYHLLAYCIMPNHVHVLFQPIERTGCWSDVAEAASFGTSRQDGDSDSAPDAGDFGSSATVESAVSEAGSFGHEFFSDEVSDSRSPLTIIMHSLKSYTANRANELLGRSGQFWQHESYDHWVRDVEELERIVEYLR